MPRLISSNSCHAASTVTAYDQDTPLCSAAHKGRILVRGRSTSATKMKAHSTSATSCARTSRPACCQSEPSRQPDALSACAPFPANIAPATDRARRGSALGQSDCLRSCTNTRRVRLTPELARGPACENTPRPEADLLRSPKHYAETILAKNLLYGLVTMVLATSAFAGERYIEVWNPPEARSSATKYLKPSAHKSKNSRVGPPATSSRTRRVAKISPLRPATRARPGRLTYNDIPRQVTPEGNVLRVVGGQSRADVER
ncbi:hypothetical protein FQZ97_156210 [compost metagenome]